jgi:hypothetical protein
MFSMLVAADNKKDQEKTKKKGKNTKAKKKSFVFS